MLRFLKPAGLKQAFVLALLLFFGVLPACDWGSIGYNKGYAPEQPLAFSHQLHAGQYKINCLYCHANAERSNHASVPSMNICMNCHLVAGIDKPNIQKLQQQYNSNEPIAWTKVHMLPDFVKFNHKRHVQKFGEAESCKLCHGDVQSMAKLTQVQSLSMGWCVDCHRQNKGPINCSTCHY